MIWVEPRRKKETGETWIINAKVVLPGHDTQIETEIRFTSNNKTFSKFSVGGKLAVYMGVYYDDENVYNPFTIDENEGWEDVAYRTVVFYESPTGALLTWLQANAVKQ